VVGGLYLLDTNALLWALIQPKRLSRRARLVVETGKPKVSVASYWEVVIKAGKGKLPIPDPAAWWKRVSELAGEDHVLPIRSQHISALVHLPHLHHDPFDRILVAQAKAEGLTLVTPDSDIARYSVPVLWK
jgi:PIN domain nuclease of toxin-antitoxin system